ncbi:MAG: DUF4240 domain-containing protein, partial [Pseudomonadota bacterium]
PAFERVMDGYFARGLYAEIEAYFTRSECYGAWPYEGDLVRWRQLADCGQEARVIRLWRNHLACLKPSFWDRIAARNAGFRKPKFSAMSDAEDRAHYDDYMARIPRAKTDLLGVMALARDWFERLGASDAQLDRLAAERAEVEAEARRRPHGKPDPRAMDAEVFWEVIGAPGDDGIAGQIEAIADRLERFKATAIKTFDQHLQERHAAAYRSDIWALAYLLADGCSDDSFAAFRCWLILQGRTVFERTLAEPDAFDIARFAADFGGALSLLDTALLAYEVRSGKPMRRKHIKLPPLDGDDLDEAGFADRLPCIAAQRPTA